MPARRLRSSIDVAIALAILVGLPTADASDGRDLIVEANGRNARIRVVVTVDGRPVEERRRRALVESIIESADKNGDGKIDESERQAAFAILGQPADGHGDPNGYTLENLAALLGDRLGSLVEVVVQPQPLVDRLELLNALDADGDSYITASEFSDAVALLDRYDADGDGTLNQPELAPTEPLQPTPLRSGENFPPGRFPFRWEAASGEPDAVVEIKLIGRAFGRPKVEVRETGEGERRETRGPAVSRRSPASPLPGLSITSESRKASIDVAGIGLDLDATPARITSEDVKRFYLLQLRQRDTDKNGYLDENEFLGLGLPGLDFKTADSNGDGMLFPDELRERLDSLIARETSRIRIEASYERQPLFTKLDSDGDERLSRRELLEAGQALSSVDADDDGRIGLAEFGGRYRLSFRVPNLLEGANPRMIADFQAMPRGPSPRAAGGPDWFIAMDRNADGDLSRREFLGKTALFTALDSDADGLLSTEEAMAAEEVALKTE